MDIVDVLAEAWSPYKFQIRDCMARLSTAPMPQETDFLWFVLYLDDLTGMPIVTLPTERSQQ